MKTVLYLGLSVAGFVQSAKLAGIRRYAGARGWEVVAIPEDRAVPETIQALLSELNPVGCIVECFGGGRPFLPPRLFGAVPAVWLDVPPGPLRRRATRFVAVDEDAVARTALREFAAAQPVSLAAVMCEPWTWARVRARAFRKQAVAAGARCRMFAARRGEAPEARAARLTSWIATLPRPCGLFAVNDGAANEVRAACRAARLHVPRDVSILGVDNHPSICETKEPTLSSIRLDDDRPAGVRHRRARRSRLPERLHRAPFRPSHCRGNFGRLCGDGACHEPRGRRRVSSRRRHEPHPVVHGDARHPAAHRPGRMEANRLQHRPRDDGGRRPEGWRHDLPPVCRRGNHVRLFRPLPWLLAIVRQGPAFRRRTAVHLLGAVRGRVGHARRRRLLRGDARRRQEPPVHRRRHTRHREHADLRRRRRKPEPDAGRRDLRGPLVPHCRHGRPRHRPRLVPALRAGGSVLSDKHDARRDSPLFQRRHHAHQRRGIDFQLLARRVQQISGGAFAAYSGDGAGGGAYTTRGAATAGHWYRFVVTAEAFGVGAGDVAVYDMGTAQPSLATPTPSSGAVATFSALPFRRSATTLGGVSCVAIQARGVKAANPLDPAASRLLVDNIAVEFHPAATVLTFR